MKSEKHKAKMQKRRAEQHARAGYKAGETRTKQIALFSEHWRGERRKNGVGSTTICKAPAEGNAL